MSTLRRARIKASAAHLASLAGKRRQANNEPEQPTTITTSKHDENSEAAAASTVKTVPAQEESSNEKPRLARLARFRPNLSESDQQRGRLRKLSGCEASLGSPAPPNNPSVTRVRTTSGSGSAEEVLGIGSPPPSSARSASPCIQSPITELRSPISSPSPLRVRQISENDSFQPPAAKDLPARTRKLTETSLAEKSMVNNNPTVFDQRKANHKKKFGDGIPGREKLTMFDLIYYNPSDGNRMSNPGSIRSSRAPSVDGDALSRRDSDDAVVPDRLNAVADRLREEAVDDPEADETGKNSENDNDDEAMPVPQVKVGADGNIILDEASTMIETTATKKAKEDLLKVPIVFENANQATNYGSWGKKKKNADWSDKETVKFYKALSVFGTDFSLMEGVFKKRSRHELKMKFKKEERSNRALVDKCLSQGQTFDPSFFESNSEDSEMEEAENKKAKQAKAKLAKKKKAKENNAAKDKKKRRHRVKGRRYYESEDSEDADESELASEQEHENIADAILEQTGAVKRKARFLRPLASAKKSKTDPEPSLLKSILTQEANSSKSNNLILPPALLAANPSLAKATPGSLVVVASPSSPQVSAANAQLLEVFMVGEENGESSQEGSALPKRTRTISENHLDTTSIGRVRTHSGTFQS